MHGQQRTITIRFSRGGKRELRARREATVYGPVGLVTLDADNVAIVHVASGAILLCLPNLDAAARATESLLALVQDWAHGHDGKRPIFHPSLIHAVAVVRG